MSDSPELRLLNSLMNSWSNYMEEEGPKRAIEYIERLEKQNKIMREALEWYAEEIPQIGKAKEALAKVKGK